MTCSTSSTLTFRQDDPVLEEPYVFFCTPDGACLAWRLQRGVTYEVGREPGARGRDHSGVVEPIQVPDPSGTLSRLHLMIQWSEMLNSWHCRVLGEGRSRYFRGGRLPDAEDHLTAGQPDGRPFEDLLLLDHARLQLGAVQMTFVERWPQVAARCSDAVTGLLGRRFYKSVESLHVPGLYLALFDIDHFSDVERNVQDGLLEEAGKALLEEAYLRNSELREREALTAPWCDVLALYLGRDEFVVAAPGSEEISPLFYAGLDCFERLRTSGFLRGKLTWTGCYRQVADGESFDDVVPDLRQRLSEIRGDGESQRGRLHGVATVDFSPLADSRREDETWER